MRTIIMMNWDLCELSVWVNIQYMIQQVWVQIRQVIPPIQGLLNPIREVVHVISHTCSYFAYHLHLHPLSFLLVRNSTVIPEHKVKLSRSISPCHIDISWHQVRYTPSIAYTQYSIHPVHNTPSTVYTKYCIHRRLSVFPWFLWFQIDP